MLQYIALVCYLFSFLYQQENQEELGLWEEKFENFVDVKVNGTIKSDVVFFPNSSFQNSSLQNSQKFLSKSPLSFDT